MGKLIDADEVAERLEAVEKACQDSRPYYRLGYQAALRHAIAIVRETVIEGEMK